MLKDDGEPLGDWNYLRYLPGMTAADDWEDKWHLEEMIEGGVVLAGSPDDLVAQCRVYERMGVDLLLCMVNPYAIEHDSVLRSVELMGRYVLPEFDA